MQKDKNAFMQNLNQLLHFDPDNPEPYLPALERVADDEVLFSKDLSYREEVRARAKSVIELMKHGYQVPNDDENRATAVKIFKDDAELKTHKQKPAVVLHLEAMLSEYDHEVVHEAARVRRYVMNKLIEESGVATNKASERIKALELLGKMSDVGMFVDRSVVTVEHKTTEELHLELDKTLDLLFNDETQTYETKSTEKPLEPAFKNIAIDI